MACSLLLCLLSVFALLVETAVHTEHRLGQNRNTDRNSHGLDGENDYETVPAPVLGFDKIINWVRVYKNPKTTPATVSGNPGHTAQTFPDVQIGTSYLLPSQHWEDELSGWSSDTTIWVNFNTKTGDGSLLPDPAKDGESGLVTRTENTTVKPGDRVAIAVNFNTWGGYAEPDMTIGPRLNIRYAREGRISSELTPEGGHAAEIKTQRVTHIEGPWCLNPNLQIPRGYFRANEKHTLVYQFVVGPEHAILNSDGPWLKQDFVTEAIPSLGDDFKEDAEFRNKNYVWTDRGGAKKRTPDLQVEAVDWLYGAVPNQVWDRSSDGLEGDFETNIRADLNPRWVRYDAVRPSATAVKPWNTALACRCIG